MIWGYNSFSWTTSLLASLTVCLFLKPLSGHPITNRLISSHNKGELSHKRWQVCLPLADKSQPHNWQRFIKMNIKYLTSLHLSRKRLFVIRKLKALIIFEQNCFISQCALCCVDRIMKSIIRFCKLFTVACTKSSQAIKVVAMN